MMNNVKASQHFKYLSLPPGGLLQTGIGDILSVTKMKELRMCSFIFNTIVFNSNYFTTMLPCCY